MEESRNFDPVSFTVVPPRRFEDLRVSDVFRAPSRTVTAAAPPNRLQGCVFTREFPLRIKRRGVEMRFAIDAPDPRATNPDPVLLKEVERARSCFDALVSGRIGSVAELASLEGISDRYEAVASVVI